MKEELEGGVAAAGKHMGNAPVFILGVGRSGTSLFHSMLNAHPEVAFLPETHFLRFYLGHRRRRLEKRGPEFLLRVLKLDSSFARAGVPPEELLAPFLSAQRSFDLADVYRRLLELYRVSSNKSWVGEKDPRYLDYLETLHEVFPDARVLHIIRDPRDVVLSRMKARWSAHRPFWLNALIYRAQLGPGRRTAARLFGDHYLEIHYEKLLDDPESVMRRVCENLGVAYAPSMVSDFGKSARTLVDPSELQWKQNTLGTLIRGNKEKWRKDLTPWQIAVVERLCREPFTELGYREGGVEASIPLSQRAAVAVAPLVGAFFSVLYHAVVRYDLFENKRGGSSPDLREVD